MNILYVLYITSWRGISIGATHYYGKLLKITDPRITAETITDYEPVGWADNEIRIQQRLTKSMAKELNQKDRSEGFISIATGYRVGEFTDRFDSTEELIKHTREKYIRGAMKDIPFVAYLNNGRILYNSEK